MGLAWFGNADWCDDRPPLLVPVDAECLACGAELAWRRPMGYHGQPPECPRCGGDTKVSAGVDQVGEQKDGHG